MIRVTCMCTIRIAGAIFSGSCCCADYIQLDWKQNIIHILKIKKQNKRVYWNLPTYYLVEKNRKDNATEHG